jgi:hypothetical protein
MALSKNCISLFALSELLRAAFVSADEMREPAGHCDECAIVASKIDDAANEAFERNWNKL